MAGVPNIRTVPVTSITRVWYDSGNTPVNNAKTLGGNQNVTYANSSYVIHSAGFNSGAAQTAATGDVMIGCSQSVVTSNDTVKGPFHASIWANAVFPVAATIGALAIYVESATVGGYWDMGQRDNYNGGWRQLICDPSSTPDDGAALSNTATITRIMAYTDMTVSTQNMFEAHAASIIWCGREITIDGGTVTAGNEIDFAGIAARDVLATRTTVAPYTGNFFGHVTDGGGFIKLKAPIQLGDAGSTNATYMLETNTFCLWDDAPVNALFYRIDITKNGASSTTTVIWGDSTTPAPVTIDVAGATLRWALFTAGTTAAEPTEFSAYGCTLKKGRAWELGSTSTLRNCIIQDVTDITLNSLTDIAGSSFIQAYVICAFIPTQALFADTTFQDIPVTDFGITITGAYGTVSMVLDNVKFQNNVTLRDIDFAHTGVINLSVVNGGTSPSYTVSGGGTVNFVQSVDVTVSGVTEGTPITVIADETVGTITKGDVILSAFADSNGIATIAMTYEPAFDPSGLDVISRARNQGVCVAAIADDGGVFTDETLGASSSTTADMTLLPAVPALNDAYYYGHNEQFLAIKQDVSTVLTFTIQPTIIWEYWNGVSWAALAGVTDNTNGFETTGENTITYTLPNDWATTTINTQGPLYYIRARLSVAGTITQTPVGTKATLDASRYIPYAANRTIVSGTGLSDIANWAQDTISQF